MSDVPHIFDRKARTLRRARAAKARAQSFLVLEAAAGVAERAGAANRTFRNALELGSTDAAFGLLKPLAENWTRAEFPENEILDVPPQSFDLAVSALALHAINDLPGALIQVRRALKPDGLFVAALFGGDTLKELRESLASGEDEASGGVSPRVAPFADVRDLGGLLQRAGFALPVTDVERLMVRYGDFFALVRDLRAHGFTNMLSERSRRPLRRDTLAALLAHYAASHADEDGKLRARFETLYLTGWAPHEGQQKPLAPGSARSRLADALGTSEQIIGSRPERR